MAFGLPSEVPMNDTHRQKGTILPRDFRVRMNAAEFSLVCISQQSPDWEGPDVYVICQANLLIFLSIGFMIPTHKVFKGLKKILCVSYHVGMVALFISVINCCWTPAGAPGCFCQLSLRLSCGSGCDLTGHEIESCLGGSCPMGSLLESLRLCIAPLSSSLQMNLYWTPVTCWTLLWVLKLENGSYVLVLKFYWGRERWETNTGEPKVLCYEETTRRVSGADSVGVGAATSDPSRKVLWWCDGWTEIGI